MEKFEVTDEFFEEMEAEKKKNLPTDEEIAARPKIEDDPFELLNGDKDKRTVEREDKSKNN